MLEILKRYRLPVLLVVYLVVTAALLIGGRRSDSEGGAFLRTRGLASGVLVGGTAGIGDAWDRYVDLVAVREQNERLEDELDRVREEHTRLLGVMQENARLRAMIGFAESRPDLELVAARVVSKPVSTFFRVVSLRLSVGDERVDVGMPVVASAGLVGYVSSVSGNRADVVLITDPRSSVDVVVQHNRARGIVRGTSEDVYDARVAYLMRRDDIEPGDLIVTSGLGGRYPEELIVGRVSRVERKAHGLFQDATVEPAVDFSRLEEVFIVVGEE